MQIEPVAFIHTPYTTKFGIPRQSGIVLNESRIEFVPKYRSSEIIRGIEGFSHLWLIWGFSEAQYSGGTTVRPPRLGGNIRMGVFATRSPFRPNGLGLSCVSLKQVEHDGPCAPTLCVTGADLLDGTPIYDIKPYLPFADSNPNAVGGFSDDVRGQKNDVVFLRDFPTLDKQTEEELKVILENDPRPHYQQDPTREYAFEYAGLHILFTCKDNVIYVKEVNNI